MKPLTANDLVVGGKYVVKLYSDPTVCEYNGVQNKEYAFKGYPVSYYLTKSDLATSVTPYHEPEQCCHLGCNDCPYEESTMIELKSLHEPNKTTMNTEKKSGVELIAEERIEQIEKHGYSLEHDILHDGGCLAKVAATLAVKHTDAKVMCPNEEWGSGNNPWGLESKLEINDVHRLKVAGALIAAEIDRLNNYNSTQEKDSPTNTDYTEQPFNLETALKHPEWVYFRNGEKPLEWHWFKTAQWQIVSISPKKEIQVNYENGAYHYDDEMDAYFNPNSPYDLILRVPCKEVFINIYPNGNCIWHDTKEEANECVSNSTAIIACVPLKIPAI